ncbi:MULTISPECIES: IS3 family transposase [Peribacillus]|uniref:IS3 family transposase n=1 Tax=Peribacillus TaxID=2675229 RepID=UPI00386589EC
MAKSALLLITEGRQHGAFQTRTRNHIHYYNHRRIIEKLKGMRPVDHRVHAFKAD